MPEGECKWCGMKFKAETEKELKKKMKEHKKKNHPDK